MESLAVCATAARGESGHDDASRRQGCAVGGALQVPSNFPCEGLLSPASPASSSLQGSPAVARRSCLSLDKVLPKGFSLEDVVSRCQRACPLPRMEEQLRLRLAALEEEHRRLLQELEAHRAQAEGGAPEDVRDWLQCWYRHRDGRFKTRWVILATLVSATGLCVWCFPRWSSTPIGRCVQRALDWWQEWRDHASAVTGDMTVMGPFIHMAAEVVRMVNDSEVVRLSCSAVAQKEPRIEYMAM